MHVHVHVAAPAHAADGSMLRTAPVLIPLLPPAHPLTAAGTAAHKDLTSRYQQYSRWCIRGREHPGVLPEERRPPVSHGCVHVHVRVFDTARDCVHALDDVEERHVQPAAAAVLEVIALTTAAVARCGCS